MAGIIVPILKKRAFNYSFLGNSSNSTLVLHPALNVHQYRSFRLLVRTHSLTMSAGQTVVFDLTETDPSSEDPQEFEGSGVSLTAIIGGSTAAGDLESLASSALEAPFIKLTMQVIQTTGSTPFYFETSVDLLLRDH